MFRLPFLISYLDDTNFSHRGNNLEMDRYQRVEKPKADTPIDENEIWITNHERMRKDITYAKKSSQIERKSYSRKLKCNTSFNLFENMCP